MKTEKKYHVSLLNKRNNTVYWCIYHSDDSGVALVFNNMNKNYEEFNFVDCMKLQQHLNKYGYELEHQDCEDFCNVGFYSEIDKDHEIHIFDEESKTNILLDLFGK